MKALSISADNFEDSELLVPYYRLKEEGLQVDIASVNRGQIKGKHGYERETIKMLKHHVKEVKENEKGIIRKSAG